MYRTRILAGALALSSALFVATGAQAWEADQVAGRLKSELDSQGFKIDWASAEKDGDDIRLKDVKVGPGDKAAVIGDVTLEDVGEDADNYTIGHVAVPDYRAEDEHGAVAVHGIAVTGLDIPKEKGDATILHYRTAGLDNVDVTDKAGKHVFTLDGLKAEMQPPPDDGTLSFSGTADAFSLDLAALTDKEKNRQQLDKLGYSTIHGTAALAGSWKPSDGHLKLSKYSLQVDDAGTFEAMVDISGYTPEFIKSLREARRQMEQSKDENNAAKGLAMLGLAQQLTFNGLSLRFEDDGLTKKALKTAAEKRHTTPDEIAKQITGPIPDQLGQYLGDDLALKLSQALGAFFADPQNIEISARPASPLPFALLAGAAMTAPQSLPQMLGVDVKAND